jgi:hypothetical protein
VSVDLGRIPAEYGESIHPAILSITPLSFLAAIVDGFGS